MLFLIPFHIFAFEKMFPSMNEDDKEIRKLQDEYTNIMKELNRRCADRTLEEYDKATIVEMSKKVLQNIAANYAGIQKGVGEVMGGKVLEYEARTIHHQALEEGKAIGRTEGKIEGKIEGQLHLVEQLQKLGYDLDEVLRAAGISREDYNRYIENGNEETI